MSEEERQRLLEAAVQGVAWALIENDTDTSDRGVSQDHYKARVADARRLLPELVKERPECICYGVGIDPRCRAHDPLPALSLSEKEGKP